MLGSLKRFNPTSLRLLPLADRDSYTKARGLCATPVIKIFFRVLKVKKICCATSAGALCASLLLDCYLMPQQLCASLLLIFIAGTEISNSKISSEAAKNEAPAHI